MKETIKFWMMENFLGFMILGFMSLFILLVALIVVFDLEPTPYRGACEATWTENGVTYSRYYHSYCPSFPEDKNELRP